MGGGSGTAYCEQTASISASDGVPEGVVAALRGRAGLGLLGVREVPAAAPPCVGAPNDQARMIAQLRMTAMAQYGPRQLKPARERAM